MYPHTPHDRSVSKAGQFLAVAALLLPACAETPVQPSGEEVPPPSFAKPPSCPAQINLTVNGLTGLSGALLSDGSDYTEGAGGVALHTSGANGNLYFDLRSSNPPRTVTVTTSVGSAPQSTRIFTNNHEQSCGLSGMGPSSTGSAVLEVEWSDSSNRYTLRYGKNCVGTFGEVVAANKIATARNGNVWTLNGDAGEGIVCRGRLNGQPNWTQVGTADAFTMTLTAP
jgi:hypothetical protein